MDDSLRKDFPIEWEEDHFVTRREFFKFVTLASGGLAAGTVALASFRSVPREERSFEPTKICAVADLQPGSSMAFSYPRQTDLCLLVRQANGQFVAYSRRCTHLSCPVQYDNDGQVERLYCPCHNGAFSLEDGRVLQGPPPRPIPRVAIEVRGEEIWATGVRMESEA